MAKVESLSTSDGHARHLMKQVTPLMMDTVRYPHHLAALLTVLGSYDTISHEALYSAASEWSAPGTFELLEPIKPTQTLDDYVKGVSLLDR
jgi:hypothetical protein